MLDGERAFAAPVHLPSNRIPAVSSSSSASGAPSVKDPSPKPHQRGSAALGNVQNLMSMEQMKFGVLAF